MKRVAVIMGSDSDLPVVSGCAAKLDELGINYEMRVMSAHRTPADVAEFAQNAYKRDFGRARGNGCRRRCGQRRDTCGSNAFACGTRTSRKA